jgi:hypothetical protein
LGGGTHLLWDSLTYDNGLIAQLLHISGHRINIANIRLHITSWLQVLSSAIGMWFIVWVILQLPNRNCTTQQRDTTINYYWIKVLIFAFIISFVRIYVFMPFYRPLSILVSIIGSLLYSLIVVPIVFSNVVFKNLQTRN